MPLYLYQCPACKRTEERLEPYTAPTIHPCPQCGADAERIPAASNFVMPGFKNGQAV